MAPFKLKCKQEIDSKGLRRPEVATLIPHLHASAGVGHSSVVASLRPSSLGALIAFAEGRKIVDHKVEGPKKRIG